MKTIKNKEYVKTTDILAWINANLIMPFEGVLHSEDKEAVAIHEKITNYNRKKFNELNNTLNVN